MKKLVKRIWNKIPLVGKVNFIKTRVERNNKILEEIIRLNDLQYRDLLSIATGENKLKHNDSIRLKTEFPIAYESDDYLNPYGTAQDNTRSMRFTHKCIEEYGNKLSFLDIGCSGGGLVFDFALRGYDAIGLEGSDFSKKFKRANWRTIPDNLFTCDVTKPFSLLKDDENKKFKVISSWEVLEHIKESDLPQYFENIKNHLDLDGIFVGSISRFEGDPLHHTLGTKEWWSEIFEKYGLEFLTNEENPFDFLDYCRGTNNGLYDSHNYHENSEIGFHFVAKQKNRK
jgi:2-polyprenyl-3-methyl-5-hydroxy-6-metoxy-1,4-benzoquinol methylase